MSKLSRNLTIRLGYVPLVDCAPLVMAHELGYFREAGLNVQLMREPGWVTIRDKVAYGELDGAVAPAALTLALRHGVGVLPTACLSAFLLNTHGDAITLSNRLIEKGVSSAQCLNGILATLDADDSLVFGVPHAVSSHRFILSEWMRKGQVDLSSKIEFITLPPSLMPFCLKVGNIDGFCVGEPFSSLAVAEEAGAIVAESAEISPFHPEKALIVTDWFNQQAPDEHLKLIRQLDRACRRCETSEGRDEVAQILSQPHYLNQSEEIIRSSLFTGKASAASGHSFQAEHFHVFHHPRVNRPTRDKGAWVLAHLRQNGLVDSSELVSIDVEKCFREDLYEQALSPAESIPQMAIA